MEGAIRDPILLLNNLGSTVCIWVEVKSNPALMQRLNWGRSQSAGNILCVPGN